MEFQATGGVAGNFGSFNRDKPWYERFHRTMQEEFYSVAFRKKFYCSLEELQADVDVWLGEYNEKR